MAVGEVVDEVLGEALERQGKQLEAMTAELERRGKQLGRHGNQLEAMTAELQHQGKLLAALERDTEADAKSLGRAAYTVHDSDRYWPAAVMMDGEPAGPAGPGEPAGPVPSSTGMSCPATACTCLRTLRAMQHVLASLGCVLCRHVGCPCALCFGRCPDPVQLVLVPPMLRCARCPAPAPYAAEDLVAVVSCEGFPADLEEVLSEVLAGHCGYLSLRDLLLLRLAVRQAASGRLECGRRQELPDASRL